MLNQNTWQRPTAESSYIHGKWILSCLNYSAISHMIHGHRESAGRIISDKLKIWLHFCHSLSRLITSSTTSTLAHHDGVEIHEWFQGCDHFLLGRDCCLTCFQGCADVSEDENEWDGWSRVKSKRGHTHTHTHTHTHRFRVLMIIWKFESWTTFPRVL